MSAAKSRKGGASGPRQSRPNLFQLGPDHDLAVRGVRLAPEIILMIPLGREKSLQGGNLCHDGPGEAKLGPLVVLLHDAMTAGVRVLAVPTAPPPRLLRILMLNG